MLMVPVAKYSEKISGCPDKHAHKRTVKKKLSALALHSTLLSSYNTCPKERSCNI